MFEKLKANILFNKLLQRPNINRAYAMVPETDSWYETIKKVHESLDEINKKPHQMLEISSKDNLKLKAIYYPNENGSNVTVICVHGYTSHAEREWAFPGLFYLSLGYNVLIPYQRAHGLSEGKYISFGALEHIDMIDWVNKINEMNPNGKIVIHGLSMGGGIVLDLSKIKMENVKCLIADAPSVSIERFFKNVSKEVFKSNSDKIAFYAIERFKKEFGYDAGDFESVEIVANSQYPILLSAGSNEHLEELFETIKRVNPNETNIVILPDCNHGNGMYKQTELYQRSIKEFLDKYI
jgi:pimeloyl-ACP methyl ester carboxylesterase